MFLPTALFEKDEDAVSTTALRALLTIFRDTWTLDQKRGGSDSEAAQTAHGRWARLSPSTFAQRRGVGDSREEGRGGPGGHVDRLGSRRNRLRRTFLRRTYKPRQSISPMRNIPPEETQGESPSSHAPTANDLPPAPDP